jgi:hypothetical protein
VTVSEAKKRILFIDDQQPVRLAAAAVLRSHGYEVDAAGGGAPDAPPIVLMSSDGENLGNGTITGRVVGYVKKPFAVGHLLETCANAIADLSRPPSAAAERRHEPRRTFHVSGERLSASGVGLAHCDLVDMSGRILWRENDRVGVKVEPPTQAHFDILAALLNEPS